LVEKRIHAEAHVATTVKKEDFYRFRMAIYHLRDAHVNSDGLFAQRIGPLNDLWES